jgi:hypothetical protein
MTVQPRDERLPLWLWQAVLAVLGGAAGFLLILLALSLGGISDPRPLGGLVLDAAPLQVYRAGGPNERLYFPFDYPIMPPATLEITARLRDGPSETGYGLWWRASLDTPCTVTAVNGDGYLTVFRAAGGEIEFVREWGLFPHVRRQGGINRLRVDLSEGQAAVYVNDELAVTFDRGTEGGSLSAGIYVESSARGGAEVILERVRIWSVP